MRPPLRQPENIPNESNLKFTTMNPNDGMARKGRKKIQIPNNAESRRMRIEYIRDI